MEKGDITMEEAVHQQQQQNQEKKEIPCSSLRQANSPKAPCTSTSSSSNSSSSSNGRCNNTTNGNHNLTTDSSSPQPTPSAPSQPPPPSQPTAAPKSLPPRSDSNAATPPNPYPTTFVQADPSSFKQVVQMLTGSSETTTSPKQMPSSTTPTLRSDPLPPVARGANTNNANLTGAPKRPAAFKLYERRGHGQHNSFKNLKIVNNNPLAPGLFANIINGGSSSSVNNSNVINGSGSNPNSPNTGTTRGGCFSPLGYKAAVSAAATAGAGELPPSPSVVLDFPSLSLSPPVTPFSAEERAIAEKGFYLHPSPRSGEPPPRLLPLFPVTSPKARADSSPSSSI